MNFRSFFYLSFFFLSISLLSRAQNSPEFDVPLRDTVIVNSGADFIIISNINDGDSLLQELSFEVTSSDESILKVDSVAYNPGNKMALIWVSEKSLLGSVVISVAVSNEDGTTTKEFDVLVSEYTHHGIKFEIHDAIFWQEVVPLNETPVFQKIIQSTNLGLEYSRLNWNKIPLTVSAGCNNPSLCDGHDFNTGFIEGYLVPKITGNYTFYMNAANDFALFLSPDKSFKNAGVIAANSDNHGKVGTVVDGSRKSGVVPLDSGKVYAIYAAQWNVHNETGGIKWELPGHFDARFIEGPYLYPEYDTNRPEIVDNVRISATGDRFVRVLWDESSDDQKLKGYNVYLNGIKANGVAVSGTEMLLESLNPNTAYSIAVTAIDHVNNESFIKSIVNFETLELDTIAPSPPTSLTTSQATGLATEISWDGASDEETYIFGYNIYLNGELYNTENLIFSNSIILKVLDPNTDYEVEIEAVDAGMNVSGKSQIFTVSTTEFDPLAENLGLKTGKLLFSVDAMSYNEGIGVNPDFKGGNVFNAAHTILFEDLKPGAIRWGALTANPLNFSDYVGANKSVTIGKFISRCNEFDAYTAFCCGVENNTDWRKDPETFIRFLEYINGPDDTPGGQLRVAEGYTEPFLKNSPGIIFEFGNEVWGSNAHNAQIGSDYNAYAAWCREIATKMRASEYYDSTKIYLAYSSRYPSREHSYGLNEKIINGDKGEVDWTAPSGYLGGNLSYDPAFPPANSELEYYQNVRNRADSYLAGMLSSHKYEVDKTGRLMEQYMYESNTTTPTYNGRLGQALLSTDYYLTAMELGSAIPTIFHLTGGQWRITEPENDYRRLPLFLTAKYFNHFCKGDVLINTYSSNQMGASGTGAKFSERPVGAHTYRNGDGYSIVLISRDYVDDHYVELDLPEDLNFNSEGKMYLITGEDFSTKNAIIDTTDITIKDGMVIKVPKYSMVLLHFGAENLEMENLPLAYYPYPKIEKIEIPQTNFTFTAPLQSAMFSAKISPAESWDKHVEWTLLHNSGNFNLTKLGLYCTVSARSQLDNDTDSLVLRASSRIGDVYDEVVLYLPSTVNAKDTEDQMNFKIYPNPANEILIVEIKTADILRIFNMKGSKVLEKNLSEGRSEVDIRHLTQGFYTAVIGRKNEQLIIQK
jgi:hypothetical protein